MFSLSSSHAVSQNLTVEQCLATVYMIVISEY